MPKLQQTVKAVVRPGDESGYVGECVEIAVVTQGQTIDETISNLQEAVALHLEGENPSDQVATLRGVKVRDLIRRLEGDGWQLARTRGSHRQFKHPSKAGVVTVAGRPGIDVPIGTLNQILRPAQLEEDS